MWKTAILLIITIIVIPIVAFKFDVPLTELQQSTLNTLLWVYGIAAFACFTVSSLVKNYSQVDKLWSTIPIAYTWIVAIAGNWEPRLVLMAVLVTIWGLRLTYNFGRRGGYSVKIWAGHEDYRWAVLQARPEFRARWKWMLFNLLFISGYQMALILLMTIPALRSMEAQPLTIFDLVLAAIIIGLVILETIADQQQWNFHKKKSQLIQNNHPLPDGIRQGFTHTGLWGLVRHPNYAAEQAVWIAFYFFSVVATGQWLNWSIIGAILLALLFWGSSNFSESISASKYPNYKDYQKQVPRFIPFIRPKARPKP